MQLLLGEQHETKAFQNLNVKKEWNRFSVDHVECPSLEACGDIWLEVWT